MQSIHNTRVLSLSSVKTVCDISKIRNVVNSQQQSSYHYSLQYCLRYIKDTKCSQFTTILEDCVILIHCLRYIKDTKCSQFTTSRRRKTRRDKLFAIYQRYEMQSIHNPMTKSKAPETTVCDISKIRNVVNSQQIRSEIVKPFYCLRYIKDTKCSQFTTLMLKKQNMKITVCDISKIRNVVNSQLYITKYAIRIHCLRYIKDTKCSQFTTRHLELLSMS